MQALPTVREPRFRAGLQSDAAPPADLAFGSPISMPAVPILYDMEPLRCSPSAGYPADWESSACKKYNQNGADGSKAGTTMEAQIISMNDAAKELGSTGKIGETLTKTLPSNRKSAAWLLQGPFILAAESISDSSHEDVSKNGVYQCPDLSRWQACMAFRKNCAAKKKDTADACRAFMKKLREGAEAGTMNPSDSKVKEEQQAACPARDDVSDCKEYQDKCVTHSPGGETCPAYRKQLRAAFTAGGRAMRSLVKAAYYDLAALYSVVREGVIGFKYADDKTLNGSPNCGKDGSSCFEFDSWRFEAVARAPSDVLLNSELGKTGLNQATRDLVVALRRTTGSAKNGGVSSLYNALFNADGSENDNDVRAQHALLRDAIAPTALLEALKAFRAALGKAKAAYAAVRDGGKAKPDTTFGKAVALDIALIDTIDKAVCNAVGGAACSDAVPFARDFVAWMRVFALRRYDLEVEHPLFSKNKDCYGTLLRDEHSIPLAFPAVEARMKCSAGAKPVMEQLEALIEDVEKGAKARADKAAAAVEQWVKDRTERVKTGKFD